MIINTEIPRIKKALGQHFLRKQSVVDNMISKVSITKDTSVMEIGCGDGFLTKAILEQTACKKLVCFEIDPEWATFVKDRIKDPRLIINIENILDVDIKSLEINKPWVLLANLPYQITFPIMFLLQENKDFFEEGVVMVQEEVAQKLVAKRGRSYSATSVFLQYSFDFELLEKIESGAFSPPPKVQSRLVYFKPKHDQITIKDEEQFWQFLKVTFKQPRRTIRNNFKSTHYDFSKVPEALMLKRAQELSFEQFLTLWSAING